MPVFLKARSKTKTKPKTKLGHCKAHGRNNEIDNSVNHEATTGCFEDKEEKKVQDVPEPFLEAEGALLWREPVLPGTPRKHQGKLRQVWRSLLSLRSAPANM